MKKQTSILILLFVSILLIGCSQNEESNQLISVSTNETGESAEVPEHAVRITVSIDNGSEFINEQQVEIDADANLLELLKQTFYVETDSDDVITSIERIQSSEVEGTEWHILVDDKTIDVSAKDYVLTGGEKIVFDLR